MNYNEKARKTLLMCEELLKNALMIRLNDEQKEKLERMIRFLPIFEQTDQEKFSSLSPSFPEGEEADIWREERIDRMLGMKVPYYKIFGKKISEAKEFRYSVFFVDEDTDTSREETLRFSREQSQDELERFFVKNWSGCYHRQDGFSFGSLVKIRRISWEYHGRIFTEESPSLE